MAVRINLASAGVWWAIFSVIPLAAIRNRPPGRMRALGEGLADSFREFAVTLRDMRHYPQTLRFLIAYLLYNDAVQAVITLAAQFGSDELKMPIADLTAMIFMVQFVAFFGSFLFDWIAKGIGAKPAVIVSLLIWTGVLVSMYVSVRNERQFFIVAAVVAIVLGGTQALSRSLILADDSEGPRGRILRRLRDQRQGNQLDVPAVVRARAAIHGQLSAGDSIADHVLRRGLLVLLTVNVRHAAAEAGG